MFFKPSAYMSLRTTDSELEILEILWETGTATVRQVNEELEHKGRNVGYTTTLKMMQIMTEKGLLDREMDGRTHVYRPLLQAGAARNALIDRVANAAFGGSAMKLVLQALGNHKATPQELSEIKALIDNLEKEQKNGHHGNQQ
jgi:BlaI family transcriptional regulator, penicillinase repressor